MSMLHSLEGKTRNNMDFSTMNIKKRLNSFDHCMKEDFTKLENKIVRTIKCN